tara:strand:- start:32 stop:493 length:462 start_codon:yes stop_codon:yes gene_type:complete
MFSFGEILSRCSTDNVVNRIKSSNLFHPSEDFSMIINHLKSYYSDFGFEGIKIPSDVIFIGIIKDKEVFKNQYLKKSTLGKLDIITIDIKFEKIVQSYCDEHSDPMHHIIFNPVTIMDENGNESDSINDVDDVCAELLVSILITYTNYSKNTN